jgi:hypothetical protein
VSRHDRRPDGLSNRLDLRCKLRSLRTSARTPATRGLSILGPLILLLGITISGCGEHRDVYQSKHQTAARINFSHLPDGDAPTKFGDGAPTIITTPPGDPSAKFHISNGTLTTDPTVEGPSASYFTSPSLGTPVTNFGAHWLFMNKDGPPASILLFVSQKVVSPPYAVRLQISRTGWALGVQPEGDIASNEGIILASGQFAKPLEVDGKSVYECSVAIAGERVEVSLPTGERKVVRDQRFADWAGPFATFGAYQPNGLAGARIGFTEVWAESRAG